MIEHQGLWDYPISSLIFEMTVVLGVISFAAFVIVFPLGYITITNILYKTTTSRRYGYHDSNEVMR